MYIERHPLGGKRKAFQGDAFYTADNPVFGVTFTYYLKDKLKTRKETRQDVEKEAAKKNQILPYPNHDQLRAEAEELKPEVYLTVYDESGAPIRRVDASVEEGFHRVGWDLRYPTTSETEEQHPGEEFLPATGQGPLVMPGKVFPATVQEGRWSRDRTCRAAEFHGGGRRHIGNCSRRSRRTGRVPAEGGTLVSRGFGRDQFGQRSTEPAPGDPKGIAGHPVGPVVDGNRGFHREKEQRNPACLARDTALAVRNENVPTSINDRVTNIMEGERFAITAPTQTHQDAAAIAADEFAQQLNSLRTLVQDFARLQKDMEAAGAPWTPGRVPEWPEK